MWDASPITVGQRCVQETPKTMPANAIVLSCPTEFDGKGLLLKTPYNPITEQGEIKLVSHGSFPAASPHLQLFSAGCVLQAADVSSTVLSRCEP